jgi:hypothetical protein
MVCWEKFSLIHVIHLGLKEIYIKYFTIKLVLVNYFKFFSGKPRSRSALKSKLRNCMEDTQNGAMEGNGRSQWTLKMEPQRVSRPVVADSHHFDGEPDQDSNPQPH